jgi:predicted transcriptional regulator
VCGGVILTHDFEFTLQQTLDEINITKNKLSVEAKIRPGTIHDMAQNKSKSINLVTLSELLNALNRLAEEQGINRTFDVKDIFVYKRPGKNK